MKLVCKSVRKPAEIIDNSPDAAIEKSFDYSRTVRFLSDLFFDFSLKRR